MAVDEISVKIGDAWDMQRKGDNDGAIRAFEGVISKDEANVDAYYGLGLAKRALKDNSGAKAAFERSKSLAEQGLVAIRGGRDSNDLSTTKDDRYMMLITMLSQRLEEL